VAQTHPYDGCAGKKELSHTTLLTKETAAPQKTKEIEKKQAGVIL